KTDNEGGIYIQLKKRWPVRIFYPIQFFKAVYKLRNRIDYAYISYAEQSWIISFSNSLILRYFKIPYIITIHWGKEPDWKFKYPFIYYFRHAWAVIGVSEPVCTAFKKTIPDQEFQYVPPLIPFIHSRGQKSDLKKKLGYLNEEKLLLFVGSMKAMKNPDKIILAFQKIGSKSLEEQNIRLILVGTGDMDNHLKEMIEKYQLEKYIRMEGLVNRDAIPDYYKASDAYVISSDYEGTSLSLLEAMYNSLVIIGSNAPGINKMLVNEQNSLLYETSNTDQLAETIIRVFSDHKLSKNLAEKAFKDFNLQYSYESMIKKYQTIFSSVSIQ
ncbi:MAG TPA: glycosyltransferase family 4 protein, partial [Puia sp.]|nr:glycosyltransferase family 4 protein [Puia sp.]